jgi:hypothetical protein
MRRRVTHGDGRHMAYPVGPNVPVDLVPMVDLTNDRRHTANDDGACACGPTVVACGDGKVIVHQPLAP